MSPFEGPLFFRFWYFKSGKTLRGSSQHIQQKINAVRIEVASISDTSITWRVTHSEDMYVVISDVPGIFHQRHDFYDNGTIDITTNELKTGNQHKTVLKFGSNNKEVKKLAVGLPEQVIRGRVMMILII